MNNYVKVFYKFTKQVFFVFLFVSLPICFFSNFKNDPSLIDSKRRIGRSVNLSALTKKGQAKISFFYPSEIKKLKKVPILNPKSPRSYVVSRNFDKCLGKEIEIELAPWYIAELENGYFLPKECLACTESLKTLCQSQCASMFITFQGKEITNKRLTDSYPTVEYRNETAVIITLRKGDMNNYYHWMVQVFPKLLLLKESKFEYDCLYLDYKNLSFQQETFEALDFDTSKIKPLPTDRALKIKKMILPFNEVSPHNNTYQPNHCLITEKLHEVFDVPAATKLGHRRIYISRNDAPTRKIVNETEFIEDLKAYGFECVTLENLSVREKMQLFTEAEIVMSYFGAGFTHIFSCFPGAKVIELIPPQLNIETFLNYSFILQERNLLTQRRLVHPFDDGLPPSMENLGAISGILYKKDLLPFLSSLEKKKEPSI